MFHRILRAAKLDADFYEMVEADASYTREAFLVVLLTALLASVGMALAYPGEGILKFVSGVVGTLLSWVAWAGITLVIGTKLTRGPETRSDMGEMLRVLGYAHGPQALILLVFIPILGSILALLGTVWSLIAGVVAIRQALDFTTSRAILTVIIGWLVVMVLRWVLAIVF